MTVVVDSSALTKLATHDRTTMARLHRLRDREMWPPIVPTAVLVESLTGRGPRDARTNRLLRTCDLVGLDEPLARRAAALRTMARRGSAVDAIVVATAEHAGAEVVLTGDARDIGPLSQFATNVRVVRV